MRILLKFLYNILYVYAFSEGILKSPNSQGILDLCKVKEYALKAKTTYYLSLLITTLTST